MFKTAFRVIKSGQIALKNYTVINPLIKKVHYKFSSPNYEKLNQSQFSKELGLESEYKKVIKIQKSNQKSSYRAQTTGFIVFLMIIGGYVFIRFIDTNQRKLLKYKLNQWSSMFYLNQQKKQNLKEQLSKDHENNLKEIFQKKYKNRSIIDVKFLQYLQDFVEKEYSSSTGKKENKQISAQILRLIDQAREKFQIAQEEKIVNKKGQFLSILEKILYEELRSIEQNKKIISKDQSFIIQNFAKFMLKKGDLNHQLLGLKYLLKINPSKPLNKFISKQQAQNMKQRLQINYKICQDSLKISDKKNIDNQSKQQAQSAKKLLSIKEQIFYSISELKKANQIRRNKINLLNDLLDQIIVESSKK